MQKFNACRKRASSTHFFSSTRVRCMSAICPAGPPKLMQPILSHRRKASPKLGRASVAIVVMLSRGLGRPVVPLLGRKTQPGEQSIVDNEAAFKQSVIVVTGQRRKPERNGVQSARLRRDVVPCRVGAPHDQGQTRQRRLAFKPEQLEHGVERTTFADVAELDILDVERNAAGFTRDIRYLVGVDEQNPRLRVEKAAYQPWASDPVYFRAPPCHPNARPARRDAIELRLGDKSQACL